MNKRFLVLIGLFVILGIAVMIHENSIEKKTETRPSELELMFPDLDPETISSIVLGSFGGNINLVKKDGTWMVEDGNDTVPADKEAIDKLFETTAKLQGLQVVSRNPDKHITFQVNAAKESTVQDEDGQSKPFTMGTMGTEVTLINDDGSVAAHFFIGKNAAMDFMTTYIRKADSDSVLLAEGYLKMIYGKGSAAAWKDLMLCKIEPDEIEKITIGTGDEAIELTQLPDETIQVEEPRMIWKMTRPSQGVIDETAAQKLTGIFRNLRASDFAPRKEDVTEYGFDNPTAVLSVTMMDTKEKIVFVFGKPTDDQADKYYLKKEGNDAVYVIPKYRVESIPKSADEFFKAS
ncbi:DUF4340 domain-containing protein [bacterium]|nr:DUF4340 domain-containing protein [candidate division CSSED10-310 bacterium]